MMAKVWSGFSFAGAPGLPLLLPVLVAERVVSVGSYLRLFLMPLSDFWLADTAALATILIPLEKS